MAIRGNNGPNVRRFILSVILPIHLTVAAAGQDVDRPVEPSHSAEYRKNRDALREALDVEVEIPEELKKPVPARVVFQKLRDLVAAEKVSLPVWIDQGSFRDHDRKTGKR